MLIVDFRLMMEPQRGNFNCQSTIRNQQSKILGRPRTMCQAHVQAPCGDGRLGRPAKPKASARQHKPCPQALACNHPLPVSPPRQRRRRLRRPTLLPQPGRSLHSRLPRSKQPIQRRARARQRRILRARAQKCTLSTTQLGIFRKDNFFEVVLDPSPDKPEKRILGPAPSCQQIRRSTGVLPRSATPTTRDQAHSFYRSPQPPSISP